MEDLLSMLQLLFGISLAAGILAHYYSRSHPVSYFSLKIWYLCNDSYFISLTTSPLLDVPVY